MGQTLGRMDESPRDRTLSPASSAKPLDAAPTVGFLACSSGHSTAPGLQRCLRLPDESLAAQPTWPSALLRLTPRPPPSAPVRVPAPSQRSLASQALFRKLMLFCGENL